MKKIIIIALIALQLAGIQGFTQNVTEKINEAKASYSAGDLENTRFALEQALQEINQIIAKEILDMLPVELGGMKSLAAEDSFAGGASGYAGVSVHRSYKSDKSSISLDILGDSPMISSLNAILSLPSIMASDPNQKKIKIAGYKALQTKSVDDQGVVSFSIQMPFDQSLLNIESKGISDEAQLSKILNTIPVADIVAKAK